MFRKGSEDISGPSHLPSQFSDWRNEEKAVTLTSGVWRMSEVSGCVHGAPHLETEPLVPGKKMQTQPPHPHQPRLRAETLAGLSPGPGDLHSVRGLLPACTPTAPGWEASTLILPAVPAGLNALDVSPPQQGCHAGQRCRRAW